MVRPSDDLSVVECGFGLDLVKRRPRRFDPGTQVGNDACRRRILRRAPWVSPPSAGLSITAHHRGGRAFTCVSSRRGLRAWAVEGAEGRREAVCGGRGGDDAASDHPATPPSGSRGCPGWRRRCPVGERGEVRAGLGVVAARSSPRRILRGRRPACRPAAPIELRRRCPGAAAGSRAAGARPARGPSPARAAAATRWCVAATGLLERAAR